MPTWQALVFDRYVRTFVRRHNWGHDVRTLARRARRMFGAPAGYGRLTLLGLEHERVTGTGGVRGEWISVRDPLPGVLFYIHGGGYVAGSSITHRPVTGALARALRCRVFSVDYRLAPEWRFPTALDDVVAAYRWVLSEGAPGAPVAIAGESAGGGLALALAVEIRDAGLPLPACVVALSPWTDLAATGATVLANNGRCAMFRPENMPAFAAAYLGTASPTDPRASPLYADLRGLPPVLFQVGSTELLLDDTRQMHERILRAGGSSEVTVYDDVIHGWQLLSPLVPEAKAAVAEIATFARRYLS